MAGRPPSEKTFANMLRIAINEAAEDGGTNLRKVADARGAKAISGDVQAIKEIADRLDGKAIQQTVVNGDEDGGAVVHAVEFRIVRPER